VATKVAFENKIFLCILVVQQALQIWQDGDFICNDKNIFRIYKKVVPLRIVFFKNL